MRVFKPTAAGGFEWVVPVDSADFEIFASFDGASRASTWRPVPVRRTNPLRGQKAEPADFPWLGSHVLVMRRRVVDALHDLLRSNGELLPLATEDGVELFAFNCQTVDALDVESSRLTRLSTGRIVTIDEAVFIPERIHGLDIFRVTERRSPTYVSERFVTAVNQARFVGLKFEQAWEGKP